MQVVTFSLVTQKIVLCLNKTLQTHDSRIGRWLW
jgi:hypothetical protein